MSTNIADNYNKLLNTITMISGQMEDDLPKFDDTEFLDNFGAKFQEQLSDAGKIHFANILEQNTLSPITKSINERFQKDYREIQNKLTQDFLVNLNLDQSLEKAQHETQIKFTKSKELLINDFMQALNNQGFTYAQEDEAKFKTTFTEYLNKNYTKLSEHLKKFNDIPAIYTKYKTHLEFAETQAKADKSKSHTVTRDPTLEELLPAPKPEPTFGLKVDIDNIKKQLLSDIAHGKSIEIKVTSPDRYALFKKMADIGFQHQSPGLALLHIIIFTFAACIFNDEKRVVKAIKQIIEEEQLFGLDPSKITLKITTPTANGDKVIREKGPLNPLQLKELQSKVNEIKNNLKEHHRFQTQTNKNSGSTLTPPESGYNSENEEEKGEVPNPGPRP